MKKLLTDFFPNLLSFVIFSGEILNFSTKLSYIHIKKKLTFGHSPTCSLKKISKYFKFVKIDSCQEISVHLGGHWHRDPRIQLNIQLLLHTERKIR